MPADILVVVLDPGKKSSFVDRYEVNEIDDANELVELGLIIGEPEIEDAYAAGGRSVRRKTFDIRRGLVNAARSEHQGVKGRPYSHGAPSRRPAETFVNMPAVTLGRLP